MEPRPSLSTRTKPPQARPEGEEVDNHVSLSRTLRFCRPFIVPRTPRLRLLALLSVFCITGYKACLLLPGLSMKIAVDALSSEDEKVRFQQPIFAVLLFLLGRFLGALFGQGQEMLQEYCSQHLQREFATHSFSHIQSLSLSFHTAKKTGETTSILGRGIQSINTLTRLIVFSLAPTIVEALFVTGIFFKLGSPLIAFTTALTVGLYVAYTGYITKWRVKFGRELREAENRAWSRATETIMNYGTVKTFGMEMEEVARYDSLWAVAQTIAVKFKGAITAFNFSQGLIIHIGTSVGLLIAAIQASYRNITVGDFILIQSYVGQLFGPLLWMGNSYGQVVSSLTNIEEVMELLSRVPEVKDSEDAEDLTYDIHSVERGEFGEIIFDDVSFSYDKGDVDGRGIRSVSFRVPAGKTVALVGPSGAGKSTVGKLLLRLYDVDSGRVLVDGKDVRLLKQESLRKAIGLVAQETVLFNDTLRNNLKYGKPCARDGEVWWAVRMASLEEFVNMLRLGLDTMTGEQGVRLSGGERQRVGIARAVLKQPGIMMLDESTSALSTIDERKIQQNLHDVCKGRTTLAIAHRLSTVMMADEILVLDQGQIVERGTHEELLAVGGLYARMWRIQSGEER